MQGHQFALCSAVLWWWPWCAGAGGNVGLAAERRCGLAVWVGVWRLRHLAACALVVTGLVGEDALASLDCFAMQVFGANLAPGDKAR